ncbi:hypothetical protein HRW07_00025 [Streptomyces lunaelactis]|uniref:hypothetical protein n=1 Tax=Streptomyces lunaelactis TaxID=1535768 RepID=UPI0015851C68|nr:hypothetical protein [Streptomyces lunaelactis]NUL01671.1 hypothetical protein [Streptomyces lunaelactis]
MLTELAGAVIERYGPYVCFFDIDSTTVPAWTETGAWVGTAEDPASIGDLIDAFERRPAVGET